MERNTELFNQKIAEKKLIKVMYGSFRKHGKNVYMDIRILRDIFDKKFVGNNQYTRWNLISINYTLPEFYKAEKTESFEEFLSYLTEENDVYTRGELDEFIKNKKFFDVYTIEGNQVIEYKEKKKFWRK